MSSITKKIKVLLDGKEVVIKTTITQQDVINYLEESGATAKERYDIISAADFELGDDDPRFIAETLEQQFKLEVLLEAYIKYSLTELEQKLK